MKESYPSEELDEMDLWETVDRIKAKIEYDTMNDDKRTQALMISFESNQVINELLEFSIGFSRRVILHK
jgi:hypothetical protein